MTITAVVNLAKHWDDAHDQGARPTCLAFTLSELNRRAHGVSQLSAEYLYRAAAQLSKDWTPGGGLMLSHAKQALNASGQPSLASCPYCEDEPAEFPPGLPDFSAEESFYRNAVSRLPIELAAISEAFALGPVGLIVRVTESFFDPVEGVIAYADQTVKGMSHAVVATGYGADESGSKYLRIRNSWGVEWGDAGYAWLPMDYVLAHAAAVFHVG